MRTREVAYRVIVGGLHPDHATIARFQAWHEKALGGLFSQVLRLLAAEGMVSLGTLSLDGTELAGDAADKANRTLSQTGKLLAEAAGADAAEDAQQGGNPQLATPRALARRPERRERLARDLLAAGDKARRAVTARHLSRPSRRAQRDRAGNTVRSTAPTLQQYHGLGIQGR